MSSTKRVHPKHAVTPPKGRPTRTRRATGRGQVFGSTAQWIAASAAIAIAFVILILVTG